MTEIINNREHRIQTMKEIIHHLHQGGDPQDVRGKLKELVRETDSTEIAAMEQQLIAEGMPVEEVQAMCDLHTSVFREILVEPQRPEFAPGHPIDTFRRENEALGSVAAEFRSQYEELADQPDETPAAEHVFALRSAANQLMDVDKHYQRKENLLFSCLERHGITGPSKVMWAKDDEVRQKLKALSEALQGAESLAVGHLRERLASVAEDTLRAVEEMIVKEENILLPMAASTLTEEEWAEIWEQSPRYGWCLVEPCDEYRPPEPATGPPTTELPADRAVMFPTGALTYEQLRGIFAALPVDLTFVDADDCVRYFSEGPDRIFARSKAIIGRKVQHCHPPKSTHIVQQILDDFRSGRQNAAEFWIEFQGRFVHIRYFAVRDDHGGYLGTLEVTQDLTRLRSLQGERRLLQYNT